MKILILEDEKALSESVCEFLGTAGHICESAYNIKNAIDKVVDFKYDILIVDIGLPDGSGIYFIEEVKKMNYSAGILIISAKDSVSQKIEGLDKGADDYLAKPFHLAELHARIKSINRRLNFNGSNSININEININLDSHRVFVFETEIELTKKEFELLIFFSSNIDKVITKATLSEHLWGDEMDYADSYDFIYSHIKNLRKKLTNAGSKDYLKTIYNVGYKFSNE
jgi:DNA-binding response OmpR family regulator